MSTRGDRPNRMTPLLIRRAAPTEPPEPQVVTARRRAGLGADAFARVRDHRAQLLAGLEDRDWASSNFNRIAGAGIPRHAGLTLANLERAKPAYLDIMLLG